MNILLYDNHRGNCWYTVTVGIMYSMICIMNSLLHFKQGTENEGGWRRLVCPDHVNVDDFVCGNIVVEKYGLRTDYLF